MAKTNLNEEINKIKEMMDFLSESFRDDYKQSAPRAKSISKIANSFRGQQIGARKNKSTNINEPDIENTDEPKQNRYEEYFSKIDDHLNKLNKYVHETKQQIITRTETFYYTNDKVLMRLTEYSNGKPSELIIGSTLFIELRNLLNVGQKTMENILKSKFNTEKIMKFNPFETVSDIQKYKQPDYVEPKKEVKRASLDLPYEKIMNEIIENFNLKKIDVDITEKNKYNPDEKIIVLHEMYYTPDLEMVAVVRKYGDGMNNIVRIKYGFNNEIMNYITNNYEKMSDRRYREFIGNLFGVKDYTIFSLNNSKFAKMQNLMIKQIKKEKNI